MTSTTPMPAVRISPIWRTLQWISGIAALLLLAILVIAPDIGLFVLWNVVIPSAPALILLAPGIWRNVCPLGSLSLLPARFGLAGRRHVSARLQGRLHLAGVLLLFALVPLRHVILDTNGMAVAMAIAGLAGVALIFSMRYEWKSGWCSGLCPVHPVEKLYGSVPAVTTANAHCAVCTQCSIPCPDSTKGIHPLSVRKGRADTVAGLLMTGGFPGFIWGWFQVTDAPGTSTALHIVEAYGWPIGGALVSLLLFIVAERLIPRSHRAHLGRFFAFASIACYYWYRLPQLIGFDSGSGWSLLADVTGSIPSWIPGPVEIATTLFFAWFVLWRGPGAKRSWSRRPQFATIDLRRKT